MSVAVTTGWRPTATLARAALVSVSFAAAAVLAGRSDLLVLATPFVVHTVAVVLRRPGHSPRAVSLLEHTSLREGEGTTALTRLEGCGDVEHAVVALTRGRWSAMRPASGVAGVTAPSPVDSLTVPVALASLRWGRRSEGGGAVAAVGPWAGRMWGPQPLLPSTLTTLPMPGMFDSHAPVPHPIGLVGTHQARRPGEGSEFSSIRPFAAGDRLRRVQWRVSLRTGTLHVTSTVAEEDSSVLLLVDSAIEVGGSGGVRGRSSSLDVAVRGAGAIAEHYLRRGDRVGMRVLGSTRVNAVPYRGGSRHLRRVLDTLARIVPGEVRDVDPSRFRFHVPPGTVVVVLSPMLTEGAVAATRALAQRGLDLVVVDTLPPDLHISDPRRQLAWRMRLLEREALLHRVTRSGVPVVAWRGPGTLDEVLRGLGRRARLPRRVAQ
jgi:uncharacterized protein (DUF58 family)